MTTIINLRGTNGSGKSTAAVGLLVPELRYQTTLAGTLCETDGMTVLIGPYPPGKTGGCDRVHTFDLMRAAIRAALDPPAFPVVLFEGITISTTFGSWAEFCLSVPFVWEYMDTPLDLCLARVRERNQGAEFKEEMVRSKFDSIRRTRAKALAAGFTVWDINHERASDELCAFTVLG